MVPMLSRDITHIYSHVDIGMLQWDESVLFGCSIRPICLPQNPSIDYSGKLNYIKSQHLNVPIWTTEQCAEISDYAEYFTEHMICAGNYKNETYIPNLQMNILLFQLFYFNEFDNHFLTDFLFDIG